jgi:outer membrane receptor protein involved in Fe transport
MRHFKYEKSANSTGDGVLVGGPYRESSSAEEADNTYKLNLSYRPDERALYYAQFSQGFRLGEPLIPIEDRCEVDFPGLEPLTQLDSDTLDAYELGSKLSFADNRVEVRGALFYNDWKNIPIAVQGDCGEVYQFNAGRAMTRGVELEGSARLSEHWRLDFSAGYLNAELTEDSPGLGLDGDRLPGTPKYNATLGLQYDYLFRDHFGFFRGDLATVGGYYNNLQEEGLETGDYTTVNLATGLQLGRWDLQVFIQNLTNSSAATYLTQDVQYPSVWRLRPRTAGVSLRYAFGAAN